MRPDSGRPRVLSALLAVGMLGLPACVPGPAALLAQMQQLDQAAAVASANYLGRCTAGVPGEEDGQLCGQLYSCLSELRTSAKTCRDAIAQGRTARDGVYTLQARDCAQAARVTLGICPKASPALSGRVHVP